MTTAGWMLVASVLVIAMILSLIVSSLRGRPLHRPTGRTSRPLPH